VRSPDGTKQRDAISCDDDGRPSKTQFDKNQSFALIVPNIDPGNMI
jgi:hypothetical protein